MNKPVPISTLPEAASDRIVSFLALRPRLFAVAYRMLGSASDAEDILQDAFLRWQEQDRSDVTEPAAFLRKIVVHLCLDVLKSARHRREVYPGEWLPEPITCDEPVVEKDVSYAVLCTLERLTPLERAAYLLHDIFELDYGEVARTIDRSEDSCRQLATRARRHLHQDRKRATVPPKTGAALAKAFFLAAKTGDTRQLARMLAEDAVLVSDGGGKAAAALNPIYGRAKIQRMFVGLAAKTARDTTDTRPELVWRYCRLNGAPAIVNQEPGGLLQVSILDISDGRVQRVFILRNPDKTAHLQPLLARDPDT